MKHAYLIIAHNEFEILQYLVSALDDFRNDIFIHFDAKVKELPAIHVESSHLLILKNRISVYWGDESMLEAEYALFEAASNKGKYRYFHLLSGVDLPIENQNHIHEFFKENDGKEFIGYAQYDITADADKKMRLYHLFPKDFMPRSGFASLSKKTIRYAFNLFQKSFGIKRNKNIDFKKGPQWVSITNDFVGHLLNRKEDVRKIYKNTYCCDEYFVQTECWNSKFKDNIYDAGNEFKGCLRNIHWKDNVLIPWKMKDFDILMASDAFFARKFSSDEIGLVKKIVSELK